MKKRIFKIFGLVLLICGIAVFFYPNFSEWKVNKRTEEIISDFEDKYSSSEDDNSSSSDDNGNASELSILRKEMEEYNLRLLQEGQSLTDAWSYEQTPVNLDALGEDDTVGYIYIPAMDITLPLYIGASKENMAKGAAVMAETSMPLGGIGTNCVIAGHRGYRGAPFFREIEKLSEGDFVYVTNPWETLVYEVTEIAVIEPYDVSSVLIEEDRDMITLLTCHPYLSSGRYRYLVYCDRAGTVSQETISSSSEGSLRNTEGSSGIEDSSQTLIVAEKVVRYVAVVLIILIVVVVFIWIKKRKKKSD